MLIYWHVFTFLQINFDAFSRYTIEKTHRNIPRLRYIWYFY